MIPALLLATFLATPQDPAPVAQGQPDTSPGQASRPEGSRESSQGAAPARDPTLVLLNSVQLIVNEECITIGDLQRTAAQQGKPVTSREEYVRVLEESADALTRAKLMEQAGRDLGYDEALVRSLVGGELERARDSAGSVAALAQELDRVAFDSLQLKENTEERVYRELWLGAVTGRFQGPGGRPYVDRYVRPGQVLLEFERQGASLDLPSKVQLDEMVIAPGLGETPESARQKAQLVRSRLANGEDFYELNATFGIPGRDPELPPIEEDKLAVVPEVRAFVEGAEPGDISELIPILRTGQLAGFRILRFVGRQEGKAASFVDRQFQLQLRGAVRERRDRASQERALLRLMEGAYVWPPELAGQATGAGATAAPPQTPPPEVQPQPAPEESGEPPAEEQAAPQGGATPDRPEPAVPGGGGADIL